MIKYGAVALILFIMLTLPNLLWGQIKKEIRETQKILKENGFDPGPIDGIYGPRTDKALRAYLSSNRNREQAARPGGCPEGPPCPRTIEDYEPSQIADTGSRPAL